jgi:hypothetical protein
MMPATIASGYPAPVPNTPAAAKHSKIAENVVARAYPGREHVGIVGRFLRLQHRINNTDGRRKIHIQISRVIPC